MNVMAFCRPVPPGTEQRGYTFLHPERRLLAYDLDEPELEQVTIEQQPMGVAGRDPVPGQRRIDDLPGRARRGSEQSVH
jgi:hypothetical protein